MRRRMYPRGEEMNGMVENGQLEVKFDQGMCSVCGKV